MSEPHNAGPGWARPAAPAPAPLRRRPRPRVDPDLADPRIPENVRRAGMFSDLDDADRIEALADRLDRHGPARHAGPDSRDLAERILRGDNPQ